MEKSEKDELVLKGRIQVETALVALAHTGINPTAQKMLQTFLDAHGKFSDGEAQDDLSIYLQGGATEQGKADIIASLDALQDSESAASEAKMAAEALRRIL